MLYVHVFYLLYPSLIHFKTANFIRFGIMRLGDLIATSGQTTLVKVMCVSTTLELRSREGISSGTINSAHIWRDQVPNPETMVPCCI
jgi:hypothetical protein